MMPESNCNDCGTFIDAQPEDVGGYILCMNCMIERERDLTVKPIAFSSIKVIKKADRPQKTADDYVRDHEIALVKLLVPKYRDIVRDLVK